MIKLNDGISVWCIPDIFLSTSAEAKSVVDEPATVVMDYMRHWSVRICSGRCRTNWTAESEMLPFPATDIP
jgi:hypothetical protein